MNRSGMLVVLVGLGVLSSADIASAQPRVSVGEVQGHGSSTVRGAAVRALQSEHSVMLISKDAVAGTAKRLGVTMPKGRKEISAALGIGAWVEGSLEKEGKTLVTNLAVIDAASGKTLGVMSYDGPSSKALVKTIRAELWTDLGELIRSGKVPTNGKKAAEAPQEVAAAAAVATTPDETDEFAEEEPEAAPAVRTAQRPTEPVEESAEEDTETASSDTENQADEEPAGQSSEGRPTPFVLGVGLAGFSRDFVYKDNLSNLPLYDLGLGPSLLINANWYPAAHFSSGAAANIGIDLRGQIAFGLDSEVKDNTSFPTSAGGFGLGVRGRLPLGSHELAGVVGYGRRTYSIGKVESGETSVSMHPYVPSTAYSFMRIGVEAHFALTEKFGVGLALAYLPTFSTGVEDWFANATANGIEGELKLGYTLSKSLEVNAAFALQRFAMAFNPTVDDAKAGKLIAGGAVDQYLSLALGMGWRFGQ